jgi:DNA-binding PadR family transcriptional regulator
VRTLILAVLAQGPATGYGVMQSLEERSGGAWRPSSGSIYPTLEQLVADGVVRQEQREDGKVFVLTAEGEAYVASHRDLLQDGCEAMGSRAGGGMSEFRGSIGQLMLAVHQVCQAGSNEQRAEALRLLSETRRALYRILAESTGEPQSGGSQ